MRKILIFFAFLFCLNNLFAQSNFIHQDTVFGRTANCAVGVPVCIDSIIYDSISEFYFFLDGQQLVSSVVPCIKDSLIWYAYSDIFNGNESGPWRLDSWMVNGRTFSSTFNNLTTLLDSMRRWDSAVDWRLEITTQTVFYAYIKEGPQYSCQNITGLSRGGLNMICNGATHGFRGMRFTIPPGIHQLIVEKTSTGQRDTVTTVTACMSSDTIRKEVVIQSSQYYCFDATRLPGRAGQLYNVCNSTSTEPLFDAPSNGCIRYLGRRLGSDTACLMMCDDLGNCATTTLIVTTKNTYGRGIIVRDTISVGSSQDITNKLATPIGNLIPINSGFSYHSPNPHTSLDINQTEKIVTITAITAGIDTIGIRICTETGICDTTLLYITAVTPQSLCLHDTTKPLFQNCPANISVSTSSPSTTAEWTIPTATDNCSTPSVSSNFNSGASFPLGTTAVIYTASDSADNTATCAFNIIVTPKPLVIDTTKRYILVARSSQQALSIRNASTSLAADAVQSNYTGGLNQQWAIKNADINSFTLSVQHSNRNLETRWGTTRSGSRLMQWTGSTNSTQKWLLIPLGNGYYKIISKASGRALSVNGGPTANVNNTYLVQLNYEGLTSQQWRIEVAPQ
jgi:hypothetical protein